MDEQGIEQTLLAIARKHLGIEALEPRSLDRADFHELHVTAIAQALDAAFEAGKAAAHRGAAA